ncbi:hypothetical protein [Kribbella sp. DT2]
MSFHAAVFIAVSLDGFIARPDGASGGRRAFGTGRSRRAVRRTG